jgi:hypothetical protein
MIYLNILMSGKGIILCGVVELHYFDATLSPGKNFDAASSPADPALADPAQARTLLCSKPF